MKTVIEFIVGLGLIYVLILALLFIFQRNLMYFPPMQPFDSTEFEAHGGEVITVTTQDGLDLTGWYRPADDSYKPIIVMFHGNAGRLEWSWAKTLPYAEAGYGLLLASYRGYYGNPGKPTEQGLYKDARAFLNWLGREDIILYGESLGSGVSVQIAREFEIKALVLEAPFTSTVDVARMTYWMFPLRALMKDQYRSIDKIKRVRAPLLIVHGENDDLIPVKIGRKLFEAANEPKTFVVLPNAGHADMFDHGLADPVLRFLKQMEEL